MQNAAFRATYHTVKVIGGRKQLQVVLEVPLELADTVYNVLGFPDPSKAQWVAVALLDEDASA